MIPRIINIPAKQSFFLFGPRQTGKSSLIRECFGDSAWQITLLDNNDYARYAKNPAQYRLDFADKFNKGMEVFVLDEVQRIPQLLNEVHYLMENYPKARFIMLGSSPRKLMRGGANLLGGRAVIRFLHPFTSLELGAQFNLDDAIRFGTLPPLLGLDDNSKKDILKAYSDTYLKEEIQMEGIVRNLGGFYRFLEVAASSSGEMLNFSNIARECQIQTRSVQSYYEILEDTLVGFRLMPWLKSERKRLVAHPKFYFFDTGITNAINRRLSAPPDPKIYGRLFEQYLILEAQWHLHYVASEARLYYWRTSTGAEVDLVVEKHGKLIAAFEFKSAKEVGGDDFSGLKAFANDNFDTPLFMVYRGSHPYKRDNVSVITYQQFLQFNYF